MNRKGFTLIELLAIIVILAIIAVVTVPIILGIIDDASESAAVDSAYGFNDSIVKGNVMGEVSDNDGNILTGTYVITSEGNLSDQNSNILNTNVSGNYPEEDSWVELDKGQVVAYSLKFNDYVVTKCGSGEPEAVKNGAIELCYIYWDKDNSGTINLGDYVKIGTNGFYVIAEPENGQVKLLAEYNLDSNSRQTSGDFFTARFAPSDFWWNTSTDDAYTTFSKDTYGYAYIYRTSAGADTNNNLKTYVNNYKNYLINDVGVNDIIDVRLMSYAEAVGTGCENSVLNTCPLFVSNQAFWLGSAQYRDVVWGIFPGNSYIYNFVNFMFVLGVRPVVIIPEASISM